MAKSKSRWRARQIRHRDAVVLSVLASSCLLAGELANDDIRNAYELYIAPYSGDPTRFVLNVALTVLGFTTYFGGIFVLLGGLHFSWGRVGRGRFLVGLGLGVSLLGLVSRFARAALTPDGLALEIGHLTNTLTGLGLLFGIVSHTLMGQYALMLKKHAKRVWRRWRKPQQEPSDPPRAPAARSSRRTARGARR